MVGLKDFCVMLLAGGIGAGSVVAVQEVKPRVTKARAAPAAKPAAVRPAAQPSGGGAAIDDCPVFAPLPGSVLADLGMAPNQQIDPGGAFQIAPGPGAVVIPGFGSGGSGGSGGGGGGGGGTSVVPEPAAWAMMVSGFGLVGLALRREPQRGGAGAPGPTAV